MKNNLKQYDTDKLVVYNNPVFVKKMIDVFIKTSEEYLLKISSALVEKDLVKINQLAHYIKPSADLLSINSITQSIRDIENATIISNELILNINYTNDQIKIVNQQLKIDYA